MIHCTITPAPDAAPSKPDFARGLYLSQQLCKPMFLWRWMVDESYRAEVKVTAAEVAVQTAALLDGADETAQREAEAAALFERQRGMFRGTTAHAMFARLRRSKGPAMDFVLANRRRIEQAA